MGYRLLIVLGVIIVCGIIIRVLESYERQKAMRETDREMRSKEASLSASRSTDTD